MSPPLLLRAALLLTFSAVALSTCNPCPPCGGAEVPYPLSTNPKCGDPSYPITCTGNKLYFNSINNTYPITSISPSDQRLTIKPSPLVSNSCQSTDFPQHGLQLPEGGLFNITGSNTIFYINCNKNILGSPLDCANNNTCHKYLRFSNPLCAKTICCDFKAGGSTTAYRIRLLEGRCRAYMSFVNLNTGLSVGQWNKSSGVELQWVSPDKSTASGG